MLELWHLGRTILVCENCIFPLNQYPTTNIMICPHCTISFHHQGTATALGGDVDGYWSTVEYTCPSCDKLTIYLTRGAVEWSGRLPRNTTPSEEFRTMIYPRTGNRPPAPPEVPKNIAEDYNEACTVFSDSPKASAALSRRCLQHLLREVAGVASSNLHNEIGEVMKTLPSHLAESIDAIRNTGNFSAHPIKSDHTGEIMPVNPGEAEWSLEVLLELFDYYCVKPKQLKEKRAALDQKLAEAGKSPMK